MKHMEGYWKRKNEWAICFRNRETMQGINTNNYYAESGIRILKDSFQEGKGIQPCSAI